MLVVTWQCVVHTANETGAGTDANVQLVIYGKDKRGESVKSDEVRLDNSGDNFEAGQEDQFKIETIDVGRPYKIRVWHDNAGSFAAWKLDRVGFERCRHGTWPGIPQSRGSKTYCIFSSTKLQQSGVATTLELPRRICENLKGHTGCGCGVPTPGPAASHAHKHRCKNFFIYVYYLKGFSRFYFDSVCLMTNVCNAMPVQCWTYGFLPGRRASPPIHRYHIILLGDRGIRCKQLAQSRYVAAPRLSRTRDHERQVRRPSGCATTPPY